MQTEKLEERDDVIDELQAQILEFKGESRKATARMAELEQQLDAAKKAATTAVAEQG